ncbi:hypothetical protein [Flavobacterium daejeonense]|uniref:hypothetical protein n=1 Tax=Flavobacterium daejeonense TaxID=350893 RepID=UPI00068BE73C|nr:hypothetical protein [Flavobacterium daejeonense]
MKKLITLAMIACLGLASYAQQKPSRHNGNPMEKFTPEQRNELMLKKMTLELDLNASQQKKMGKIIAEQSAKREAHLKDRKAKTEKPTSDEIFAMKSKMLDEQIAMNGKMKKILSTDQFKKWDEMKKHHREGMKKHFDRRMVQNRHNKGEDFKRMHRDGIKKNMMRHKDSTQTNK